MLVHKEEFISYSGKKARKMYFRVIFFCSVLLGGYKHLINDVDHTVLCLNVSNFYCGIIDFYNALLHGDIHVRSLKCFCGAQLDYISSHYFPVNNVIQEDLL